MILANNSFGHTFRLTTFGESHGLAVGGVIDGCPAGLTIDIEAIRHDLQRRQGCGSEGATPRHEENNVEWLSGLLDGKTLGTPIAFLTYNRDAHSEDYLKFRQLFRPGHCDYTWQHKYGIRDWRGGGRSAARETVARVVAGSIAKQLLAQQHITIDSQVQLGGSPADGDTVGGIVECRLTGCPVGLGAPLFGKLQSQLAAAMFSIPSVTGFEVGEGFRAATMAGSQYMDRWCPRQADVDTLRTATNHCGGIQGGLSNGMPIVFRVAFHPVITIAKGVPCVDKDGQETLVIPQGRHDSCHVPRAAVIVEAMAALVIVDNLIG